MFIFAHIFFGALIGLGFWRLTDDLRALPLGIFGAVFPDLLDKSLALLLPGIFGSGRTLGHTLLFITIAVTIGILLWHYRHTLLGVVAACALFSHEVLDAMWNLPSAWFFPLLGPFPVSVIPDYIGRYFWLEISNPSEWVFACASLVIIVEWFFFMPDHHVSFLTPRRVTTARYLTAFLLGVMGLSLLFSRLAAFPGVFFAPTYDPITDVMAGCLALSGTIILVKSGRIYQRSGG